MGMCLMRLPPASPLVSSAQWRRASARFPPCLPGADTDASGGDAITKGFNRETTTTTTNMWKGMGCWQGPLFQAQSLLLQSPYIDSLPSLTPDFPRVYIHSKKKSNCQAKMCAVFLLKFGGEEGRGRKRLDFGGAGGVDNGCLVAREGGERKREGEKGKAGMHTSLSRAAAKKQRKGCWGQGGGVCVYVCQKPYRKRAKI